MNVELVENNVPGVPIRISKELIPSESLACCPIHIHDDIEILAGTGGQLDIMIDEQIIPLREGDVVIINRRVPHSTAHVLPYTTSILLQFRIEKLRADEFENVNKYLSLILADTEKKYTFLPSERSVTRELFSIIAHIHEESVQERDTYGIVIKGYMEVLLGLLYRHNILYRLEDGYNKETVKRVWPLIEYIDRHYPEPITLDTLSECLHLNREYVCRLFKEATGMPPIEYINYVRVLKAETLLTTTHMSILEIAMNVGFSSASYFNRIFKKRRGISPSVYKTITYAKGKLM